MPKDLLRIKRNVSKMVSIGAPEKDIDTYITGEGTTIDEVKNFKPSLIARGGEILKTARGILPEIGQIGGGFAGTAAGTALAGRPYVGGAVGGTVGRGVGKLLETEFEKQPARTALKFLSGPLPGIESLIPQRAQIPPETFTKPAMEMAKAAPFEVGAGVVGGVISGVGKHVGRGLLKGMLGARVAERGSEVGWRRILKPEYFKDRIPKEIASKMDNFFNRVTNVTGRNIDTLLNSPKYKNTQVILRDIKDQVRALLPQKTKYKNILQYIDDLDISGPQKEILKRETNKILSAGGKGRKLSTLWEMRRNLDKVIYGKKWGEEAYDYLRSVRRILNNPIKNAGDDIAQAFGKYEYVKNAEDDLTKKLLAIKDPSTGEIYAQPLESFTRNLLSSGKDETIRMLKGLDNLLQGNDRIIEKALDYAAAEALQKPIRGFGPFAELMSGIFGGRKGIARVGQVIQSLPVQATTKAVGRLIPTMLTSAED